MRGLLIAVNAKYIHSSLGVYSLESYARAHGVPAEELEICEYTINQDASWVVSDIFERRPDFMAFSCYIWNISFVEIVAAQLRQILPEVPIWVGGPEVSYDASQFLREHEWADGVMRGEGEETFLEVVQVFRGEGTYDDIRGITYKKDGDVYQNPDRPLLDLDELVFPYPDRIDDMDHRIVYYETSRGCPYGCSYCLSSVEKKVRFRSLSLVEKELQFFLDHRVPQVKFVDRTFNCSTEHTMGIWKYIFEHDNGITNFHFELSADLLTEEEIAYVRQFRPGLVQFEIGVQTTNPKTIEAIYRRTNLDSMKQKVAAIHAGANIHQHLDLIAGLPWEDYDSFGHSFDEVYSMQPDQLQLGFLKVLTGSPMHRERELHGIAYQQNPPYEVLSTKWLEYGDVQKLKRIEDMVERYYNSMQYQASLPYLIGQATRPFLFFQSLGDYYHECGWDRKSVSRMAQYEILFDYAIQWSPDGLNLELLRELMLYDLYAREKVKKLPEFLQAWSVHSGEDKECIRSFYQDEARRQRYLPGYEKYDGKQCSRMTHLEHFHWNLPEGIRHGRWERKDQWILFDYQSRNPLDYQARSVPVPLDCILETAYNKQNNVN